MEDSGESEGVGGSSCSPWPPVESGHTNVPSTPHGTVLQRPHPPTSPTLFTPFLPPHLGVCLRANSARSNRSFKLVLSQLVLSPLGPNFPHLFTHNSHLGIRLRPNGARLKQVVGVGLVPAVVLLGEVDAVHMSYYRGHLEEGGLALECALPFVDIQGGTAGTVLCV